MSRLPRLALVCGVIAILLGVGAALAAGADLVGKYAAFLAVAAGMLLAVIGVLLGLIAVVRARGQRGRAALGLALSAAYLGFLLSRAASGLGAPMIHDVTTDPVDPPAFVALKLSPDNLRGVGTVARWRELHEQAYADIRPLALPIAPAAAIGKAERLARERGWAIALADPAAGRLEATARTKLMGFEDDVVILARPAAGGGSTLHARSVSRIGLGDVGANARRLREFFAAMAE